MACWKCNYTLIGLKPSSVRLLSTLSVCAVNHRENSLITEVSLNLETEKKRKPMYAILLVSLIYKLLR